LLVPEQCVCGNCGKETTLIGYETAERSMSNQQKYFVRATKRMVKKQQMRWSEIRRAQSTPGADEGTQ
jgi:hypothetical protein